MNTQKHTPGPWGVRQTEAGPKAIFNADGIWIATTLRKAYQAEDSANARLIAAAPELLEALHAIVNTKIAVLCERASDRVILERLLFNASVAIEKATGGAA